MKKQIQMEGKKMKYSIDRIEEKLAIIQNINNGEMEEIELSKLPAEIKEGTIIIKENDNFILDEKSTTEIKSDIKNRFSNLIK